MTFTPHRLLSSGHAMTIAAATLRSHPPVPGTTESVFRTERDTRVLALCNRQRDRPAVGTIVALHGLTGHADAPYLRSLAAKAFARGFDVVRLNARNCGGTEHLTPTLYHSGLTSDARSVLEQLGAERAFLVGFSMGGNVLLKLAGELGADGPRRIGGVAAVSPPIDLASASRAIDTGLVNAIYQRTFLRSLTDVVRRKARSHPERYDLTLLRGVRSLYDFDERYIAPMFGFSGAIDYYRRASALPYLASIDVPAVIIHSRDDSIIPSAPFETLHRYAPIELLMTDRGGHTGFIGAASPGEDRHWAENRLLEWIVARAC
jgi:hypothetical protein